MMTFFHRGNNNHASYRYRAAIPAKALGVDLNNMQAEAWVFSKPMVDDIALLRYGKRHGKTVIVDICDAHLDRKHYRTMIDEAHVITACTPFMAQLIYEDCRRTATVIDDPYELDEREPHVSGGRLFWFGHPTNYYSLEPWLPAFKHDELIIMTDVPGAIPWSQDGMRDELARADIVLLPETAPYKTANRALEAIRQGCMVVAEPHPSLIDIPGIWLGNLQEGVQWTKQHANEANARVREAQDFIRSRYAPRTQAAAWKALYETVRSACTSGAETSIGRDGSTSMVLASEPTLSAMSGS